MGEFLVGLLGQIAMMIGGSIGGAISLVTSLLQTSYNKLLSYNKEGIALARQMGLNAKEAEAYTTTLIARARELGKAYGIAAEQVIELQKNLSVATSRQLMLDGGEAERMVQINNVVGSEVQNQFINEMMNGMGAQLNTVQGAVSKAYATAAKSGLNAQKMSEKIASNLNMANRLSFRNGVDGLTRMAMQAEKMGMSLQSVESAANNFLELDKSIENAAHMQMLGGSAAVNFGNPLTAAFEANYDPEAFAERMQQSLASYAEFDSKSGIAHINGMNMDFVRGIANAMGISVDEASKMAKKNAEVRYKEGAFGGALGQYTKEQRDFILNKSYVENGRLMINDAEGKKHDITSGKLGEKLLEEMTKFNGKSDTEIMEEQARTLISIDERIQGYETSFFATIAESMNKYIPNIDKVISYVGNFLTSDIAPRIAHGVISIGKWLVDNGPLIKEIADTTTHTIADTLDFFRDNWSWLKWVLGAILAVIVAGKGVKTYYELKDLGRMILGRGGGAGGAAAAAKGVTSTVGGGAAAAAKGVASTVGGGAGGAAAAKGVASTVGSGALGGTAATKGGSTFGSIFKFGSKGISKVLGAAFASVMSAGLSGMDFNEVKAKIDELDEKYEKGQIAENDYKEQRRELVNQKNEALGSGTGGAVGGVLGSLLDEFLGPFGTILGAAIGDFLGGIAGSIWNSISNGISDFWNGTVKDLAENAFGRYGVAVVNFFGSIADSLTDGVGTYLEYTIGGLGDIFGGIWESLKINFNGWLDGLSQIFKGNFIEGFNTILKANAESSFKLVKGVAVGALKVVGALPMALYTEVKGLFNGLFNLQSEAISMFKDKVRNVFGSVKEGILSQLSDENRRKVSQAVSTVTAKFNEITDSISNKWNGFISKGEEMWNFFVSNITQFWDETTRIVTNTWDKSAKWVNTKLTQFGDWLKENFSPLVDFFNEAKVFVDKVVKSISDFSLSNFAGQVIGKGLNFALDSTTHNDGGIIGGNSYQGDRVITRANSGEMVINGDQQYGLFNFIKSLPQQTEIVAKPVGEKEHIYIPKGTETYKVGDNTIKVSDFNINLGGTIRLDGGSFIKSINANDLLNDAAFISSLKDMIKESINHDMNGGRLLNDLAYRRGGSQSLSIIGR